MTTAAEQAARYPYGNPEPPAPGRPLDCGHEWSPPEGGTGAAGYARTVTGRTVCYRCADEHEREAMRAAALAGEPFAAYLDSDGRTITTWTGGTLARVTDEVVRLAFGGRAEVTHIRANDPHGRHWYGKGSGRGMFIVIRPNKESTR